MIPEANTVEENEANYFAMSLLMPESFLRKDIAEMGGSIDIGDDVACAALAKKYGVSVSMMAMRLVQVFRPKPWMR